NKYLSQYLLRCGCRILTTFITVSLIIILSEEFNINSDSVLIGIILAIGSKRVTSSPSKTPARG
ncbi:MAG: hypothetical protein KHZ99_15985, partial [Clostridium sp.]